MGLKPHLLPLILLLSASAWGAEDCQLSLSESKLDFGLMNRAAAQLPTPERLLGERRFNLTLNCQQPTDVSVFYRAMGASAERFRFTERGSYGLRVTEAVLDGQAVELGLVTAAGQPPVSSASTLTWRPEHGVVPLRNGVAASGRSLSLRLEGRAWASEEALRVRDAVTWDSAGLFDAVHTGQARELRWTTRFAPAACTPSLSNGGTVALGKLSVNDLNPRQETTLAPRSLVLNVACDAPSFFALRMHDNRQGTASGPDDDSTYGLGRDARQQNIGRYRLSFNPAHTTADNLPQVYRTDSTTAGTSWSNSSANPIDVGATRLLGFTASAGSSNGPSAIQHLSATANVEAVIAPLDTLDLSNEVRLDGSGTLEIIYL
ncbi:hypothetical protein cym2001_12150 [Pseudomonas sp. CYM-20-01]|uniref:DUF1120 domain-containing protein n=1 Tax=Pseudomonas sp. CYM-20-01 TaxID=2870750 RepID=UPI002061F9B1|nr:DUF1120 domain-containing protein [Pseudomonas sp. CYM-20-01]BDB17850.1 hypothetical protein cym2001_12150 [Pseudomonas sp. CYM-20-01]